MQLNQSVLGNSEENKVENSNQQQDTNTSDSNQEKQQLAFNKSSILLLTCHNEQFEMDNDAYCKGKRISRSNNEEVIEENLKYRGVGMFSYKMRTDDYEQLLNRGFSRCGPLFYSRNSVKSCCESYQYRVDHEKFKPSDSQRKVMKQFGNYLQYGSTKKLQEEQKEKQLVGNKRKLEDNLKTNTSFQIERKRIQSKIEDVIVEKVGISIETLQKVHKVQFSKKQQCIYSNILMILKTKFESKQIDKEQLLSHFKKDKFDIEQLTEVNVKENYLNFYFNNQSVEQFAKNQAESSNQSSEKQILFEQKKVGKKVLTKIENQEVQQANDWIKPQNYFKNYVSEYENVVINDKKQPVHVYTIELHKAIYTDEAFELYQKYEIGVHKKEATQKNFKQCQCNSPVYDPDSDSPLKTNPSPSSSDELDAYLDYQDEGIYPGKGSFHMYHRIDGRLIAVGVIDILSEIFVSGYFFYDPELSFLHLGVVGAIMEMQYMKLLKQQYALTLKYYDLGSMVPTCSKVNYKLNYRPGMVICPDTKELVYYQDVKEKIDQISQISYQEKLEMKAITLLQDQSLETKIKFKEAILTPLLPFMLIETPLLLNGTRELTLPCLSEEGRKRFLPILCSLLFECSFQLFDKFIFEMRIPPEAQNENQISSENVKNDENVNQDKINENEGSTEDSKHQLNN